jgi:hypothetical protein
VVIRPVTLSRHTCTRITLAAPGGSSGISMWTFG